MKNRSLSTSILKVMKRNSITRISRWQCFWYSHIMVKAICLAQNPALSSKTGNKKKITPATQIMQTSLKTEYRKNKKIVHSFFIQLAHCKFSAQPGMGKTCSLASLALKWVQGAGRYFYFFEGETFLWNLLYCTTKVIGPGYTSKVLTNSF